MDTIQANAFNIAYDLMIMHLKALNDPRVVPYDSRKQYHRYKKVYEYIIDRLLRNTDFKELMH